MARYETCGPPILSLRRGGYCWRLLVTGGKKRRIQMRLLESTLLRWSRRWWKDLRQTGDQDGSRGSKEIQSSVPFHVFYLC
ncbi:hypothetical protein CH063_01058 [Colletotrichum higginsianum]|uniref:Uncharacterized protein n=1 Tax=Colletotrichum higginsianum (strain IMI 349063) TaxID=759273 RepID=H1V150_COLHI|nr:hypothetical protein CH063_01058 [Colletotrichum higginsianum]